MQMFVCPKCGGWACGRIVLSDEAGCPVITDRWRCDSNTAGEPLDSHGGKPCEYIGPRRDPLNHEHGDFHMIDDIAYDYLIACRAGSLDAATLDGLPPDLSAAEWDAALERAAARLAAEA